VICCQYESDAKRIRAALPKRLAKFKLVLNEEKTKLIPFDKIEELPDMPTERFFMG
jgi:RNA-directed DNA polymerase